MRDALSTKSAFNIVIFYTTNKKTKKTTTKHGKSKRRNVVKQIIQFSLVLLFSISNLLSVLDASLPTTHHQTKSNAL